MMFRGLVLTIGIFPLAVASHASGAVPATQPSALNGNTQATANEPREAVLRFMQALNDGDRRVAFDNLYIANDADRKQAEAILGETLANNRFPKALEEVYGEKADDRNATQFAEAARSLKNATVRIDRDAAVITVDRRTSFYTVLDQGRWKFDFSKMGPGISTGVDADEIAAAAARAAAVNEVIADVEAHKLKTSQEAHAVLQRRLAKLPENPRVRAARIATAKTTITTLRFVLSTFAVDNGRYPTTAEGLNAFLAAPGDVRQTWRGPYIDKVPLDPWGNPYVYRFPGAFGPTTFDLFSAGPDGKPDTDDDVK